MSNTTVFQSATLLNSPPIYHNETSFDIMNTIDRISMEEEDADMRGISFTRNTFHYEPQRQFKGILETIDIEKNLDFPENTILNNELQRVLQNTEPHSTPLANKQTLSPPQLIRNNPCSNIWVENEDGTISNLYGTVLPTPLYLFTENKDNVNADEDTANILALEEGIARGHVNVRKPH
jgi:hypothetical protein